MSELRLTPRQVAIVTLLAEGLNVYQIATETGWSGRTVKFDLGTALLENGLQNRTHLVARALREGLLAVEDASECRAAIVGPRWCGCSDCEEEMEAHVSEGDADAGTLRLDQGDS